MWQSLRTWVVCEDEWSRCKVDTFALSEMRQYLLLAGHFSIDWVQSSINWAHVSQFAWVLLNTKTEGKTLAYPKDQERQRKPRDTELSSINSFTLRFILSIYILWLLVSQICIFGPHVLLPNYAWSHIFLGSLLNYSSFSF
jgi:hypothetical protein